MFTVLGIGDNGIVYDSQMEFGAYQASYAFRELPIFNKPKPPSVTSKASSVGKKVLPPPSSSSTSYSQPSAPPAPIASANREEGIRIDTSTTIGLIRSIN